MKMLPSAVRFIEEAATLPFTTMSTPAITDSEARAELANTEPEMATFPVACIESSMPVAKDMDAKGATLMLPRALMDMAVAPPVLINCAPDAKARLPDNDRVQAAADAHERDPEEPMTRLFAPNEHEVETAVLTKHVSKTVPDEQTTQGTNVAVALAVPPAVGLPEIVRVTEGKIDGEGAREGDADELRDEERDPVGVGNV